jgi:hypothetical protein
MQTPHVQTVVREVVRCRICDGDFLIDGPSGFFPHLVREHPESHLGHEVLRALARLALPPGRA